jgi:ketosteroid isomerase-like protein
VDYAAGIVTAQRAAFDFAAYAAAIERKDVPAWSEFFAEHAEWYEYRERNPPRAPNVMRGRAEIRSFLQGVAASPVELRVSHELVGPSRAAYRLTVSFEDGRRIIEHVIVELVDGKIAAEVDVEAWDEKPDPPPRAPARPRRPG